MLGRYSNQLSYPPGLSCCFTARSAITQHSAAGRREQQVLLFASQPELPSASQGRGEGGWQREQASGAGPSPQTCSAATSLSARRVFSYSPGQSPQALFLVLTLYPCGSLKWFDSSSSDAHTVSVQIFSISETSVPRKTSSHLLSIYNTHRCSDIHTSQLSPEVAEVSSSHFTGEEPEAKFQMRPGVQRRVKWDLNRC